MDGFRIVLNGKILLKKKMTWGTPTLGNLHLPYIRSHGFIRFHALSRLQENQISLNYQILPLVWHLEIYSRELLQVFLMSLLSMSSALLSTSYGPNMSKLHIHSYSQVSQKKNMTKHVFADLHSCFPDLFHRQTTGGGFRRSKFPLTFSLSPGSNVG